MDPLVALAVFCASVLDDVGYVFFVRRVMDGSRWSAAILSAALTAIVSLEGYAQYAINPAYIVANAVGSALGTPLAMWIEEKWPRKKPRDKQGRFKPEPSIEKIPRDDVTP